MTGRAHRHARRSMAAGTAMLLAATAACSSSDDAPAASVVQVFGPYREGEADDFTASFDRFTDDTGIAIRYVGSVDFIDDLRARAFTGRPPDIAIVPQPALVDELIEVGALVPLSAELQATVLDAFGPAAAAVPAEHNDYGLPFRTSIKSLVWYRPEVFDANGWSVPNTLDELQELVDQITADAELAPWCLGIRSGAATGWPASDWVEDLLLRSSGNEVYDLLASGDFAQIESELAEAMDLFGELVGQDGVVGGRQRAASTDVQDSAAPLFLDGADGCAMFKQADFALGWMPDGTEVGVDVTAFVLPGVDDGGAQVVVGGDTIVQFRDDDAVTAVLEHLASADATAEWAANGGFLSSRTDVRTDDYFSADSARLLELLRTADVIQFDASDEIDIEFAVDVYLPALTRWVAGSLDTTALITALTTATDAGAS